MGRRYFKRRRYTGKRKSERGRSRLAVLFVLLFTLAVILLTVLLGLDLRKKAEKLREEKDFMSSYETDAPEPEPQTPSHRIWEGTVQAPFVSLEAPHSILIPQDAQLISTVIKDRDGRLFYRSAVLEAVSGPQNADLPTAEELVSRLGGGEIGISAVFFADAVEGMDSIAAQAIREMTVLQMCELARAGVSEIILADFDISDPGRAFLESAIQRIRDAGPNVRIGVAVPGGLLTDGEPEELKSVCNYLSGIVEVIAIDLTGLSEKDGVSAPERLMSAVERAQVSFVRFNLRCIFGGRADDAALLTGALQETALNNYQLIWIENDLPAVPETENE